MAGCFRFRWCRLGQLRLQHVKDDVEEKKKHFEKSNPFKSKCNPFLHSVNIMILFQDGFGFETEVGVRDGETGLGLPDSWRSPRKTIDVSRARVVFDINGTFCCWTVIYSKFPLEHIKVKVVTFLGANHAVHVMLTDSIRDFKALGGSTNSRD